MENSLIILGNGFDLNCKLNSSFSNFFESKIDTIRHSTYTDSNINCPNIWYLFFFFSFYDDYQYDSSKRFLERINNDSPLWADVEFLIKKIVAINKKDDELL